MRPRFYLSKIVTIQSVTGRNTNRHMNTWKSMALISYFPVGCQSPNLQANQTVIGRLNITIDKVRWSCGDQGELRSSLVWLAKARIKGNLEWVQYHSPGTEVRYLAFSWLPMILNTTDKLRSRHKAVLKAPACP